MTTPARVAGLRGKLPAKAPEDSLPLGFIHEYTGPLPAPQYPIDVSGGIASCLMLGNGPDPACTTHPDGVGDCGYAARPALQDGQGRGVRRDGDLGVI